MTGPETPLGPGRRPPLPTPIPVGTPHLGERPFLGSSSRTPVGGEWGSFIPLAPTLSPRPLALPSLHSLATPSPHPWLPPPPDSPLPLPYPLPSPTPPLSLAGTTGVSQAQSR